jgi:hypothetical protein
VERADRLYRLLDELADAGPGDPRVTRAAELLAELVPAELLTGWEESGPDTAAAEALFSGLSPAQSAAVWQGMRMAAGTRTPKGPQTQAPDGTRTPEGTE